eukprot:scaffold12996_cov79-Skeletonema_dohrnii-CCMP3373.AAC.3
MANNVDGTLEAVDCCIQNVTYEMAIGYGAVVQAAARIGPHQVTYNVVACPIQHISLYAIPTNITIIS